jgi:hypothetical protein
MSRAIQFVKAVMTLLRSDIISRGDGGRRAPAGIGPEKVAMPPVQVAGLTSPVQ